MKLFHRLLLGFLAANVLTAAVVIALGATWWMLAYSAADARRDGAHAAVLYERGDRPSDFFARRIVFDRIDLKGTQQLL